MPFPIKYNSGNVTGSIIKGNVALAVNDVLGPTSTTGWYDSPNFTQGTYQIVQTSASGDPEVFCPQNEAELIKFTKWKGGLSGVTGSSTDALIWIGTQPDLLAINEVYPNIVTDGDILTLDAGFAGSYPVDPSQVNLIYSNGVYSPLISNLTIAVTQSTLIPNNKFRLTTPSNYISPYTYGSFRIRFPLSVLVNAQPYNLSFKYQLISGSLFSMSDWNDTALFNVNNTDYGTYIYSSAAGVRSTYSDVYRFMDFNIQTSSIVDIWDIQLTQNVSASLFNTGSGTTWYDISGNNRTGSLVNGTSFNTNNYMVLDGVNDYISLNTSQSLTNNYTLRFLFKTNTTSSSTAYFQMLNSLTPTSQNSIKLEWNNRLLAYNNSSSLQAYAFAYPLVPAFNLSGSFSDMQITVDSNNVMTVYNNGVACTPTTTVTGSLDFQVLGRAQGSYLAESIAGFQLYNRVLSQAEINQNYYQSPIVTNGLVFATDAGNLVSFERGSLKAYSLSLSGSSTTPISCSLVNGLSFNSNNGGNFIFDGTDDQLLIEQTAAQSTGIRLGSGTTPWMVNAWVKTTTGGSNGITTSPILSNRSGGPVYSNMGIGAGGVMKYAHYSGSWIVETGSIAINNNQWHMLSWVNLNNNTLNMYVDGIFDKNVSSSIVGQPNPVDIIGASWAGYFSGSIAFLSISISSSLYTTQDVLQNFNAQKARFGF